jgi:hypothetical protein
LDGVVAFAGEFYLTAYMIHSGIVPVSKNPPYFKRKNCAKIPLTNQTSNQKNQSTPNLPLLENTFHSTK